MVRAPDSESNVCNVTFHVSARQIGLAIKRRSSQFEASCVTCLSFKRYYS